MLQKKKVWLPCLLGVVLMVVIFFPKGEQPEEMLDEVDVVDSVEVEEIVYQYGIPLGNYEIDYGLVKPNQSLSVILQKHGLTVNQVHQLVQAADSVFDVRKIRSGQAYAVFTTKDSMHIPSFFVYEEDPRSYVVFDVRGEYKVSRGYHPVKWVSKQAMGEVESSLWVAMQKQDTDPQLAVVLSNIFGWTIDFFGIQKKDEYRVLYEQEEVDGKRLLNFNVIAASFRHGDSTYYAITFEQDGEVLYYNDKVNSLEGAFLKAPLDYFRITSRFTNSRFHPVLKRYRAHHGVDYAAPVGTPVYAIGSGRVIDKGYQAKGGGNYVKIKHNSMYTTIYMHLSRFAKGLKVGKTVAQKEVIGYVGSTGLSTGPHSDFRVYENGKPINPLTIKSQPKKPISSANMPQFQVVRDSLIRLLQDMTFEPVISTDTLQRI